MRYHRWPEAGIGTLPGYTTRTHKKNIAAQPLGHTYDWDNMPLTYTRYSSSTAQNAVATLMRDCAYMIFSDFGPMGSSGTGAYVSDIAKGLQSYMGYDKRGRCVSRSDYSFTEWTQMMKGELDASRPVIYAGYSNEGGHAFVLDGYDTENYFRVNWGWSGYCNGYYLLSALDPVDQGSGGSGGHYNEGQQAVIGLKKDEGGAYIEELRFIQNIDNNGKVYNGFTSSDKVIKTGKPFSLDIGFLINYGTAPFTGNVYFACVDKNENVKENLLTFPIKNLPCNYGYMFTTPPLTITKPIAPGDRIRAYWTHTQTNEIKWVKGNEEGGCVWDFILPVDAVLEKGTSLTYNNRTKLLTLQVPARTVVQVFTTDGNNISHLREVQEQQVSIDTKKLSAGTYLLRLQLDNTIKELKFKVGAPMR